MKPNYSTPDIDKYRDSKWRLSPELRVKTESQALRFIRDVGFCLLFSCKDIPLPKMSESAVSKNWEWWKWKDTLQAKKKWYNGRIIRKKATLVSLDILPCLLKLYYSTGGCEVYEEEFYYGRLTRPAYDIADHLYHHGPTSIDDLRKKLAYPGKQGTRKFHHAILELQLKYKIAVSGIVDKSWGVRVIDLFSHWIPDQVLKESDLITPDESYHRLILKYMETAGISSEKEMCRNFGWDPKILQPILESLITNKEILTYSSPDNLIPFLIYPTLIL